MIAAPVRPLAPVAQLPRFAAALLAGGYAPRSVDAYLADAGSFGAFLRGAGREPDWTRLRRDDVPAFLARERRRLAPATLARRCCGLRCFLRFLIREGIAPRALLGTFPAHLPAVVRRTDVLSPDEVERLCSAPDTSTPVGLRDAALLRVLAGTGLRISAALDLDLDADPDLDDAGRAALGAYLRDARPGWTADRPEERALFVNHRGRRLARQGFWLRIGPLAERAGLGQRVSARTLRRTWKAAAG